MHCPLCDHSKISFYTEDKRRRYLQCDSCQLVFVEPQFLPSLKQETSEYALHQNHFDDPGYISYLSRIIEHAPTPQVKRTTHVLDFGCGPSPVLAALLHDLHENVSYYDPIFYPNQAVFEHCFDLIVCTEAIEHFHTPKKEWALLTSLLTDGGTLLVMTKRVLSKTRFDSWHYKNDPTHVCFFSESTFEFLAQKSHLTVDFPTADIAVFRKQ